MTYNKLGADDLVKAVKQKVFEQFKLVKCRYGLNTMKINTY